MECWFQSFLHLFVYTYHLAKFQKCKVSASGWWVGGNLELSFQRKKSNPSKLRVRFPIPWERILLSFFLPPIIISHKSFPKQIPHWFVPLPYGDPLWLLYFWLEIGSSLFVPLLGALFNRLESARDSSHIWKVDSSPGKTQCACLSGGPHMMELAWAPGAGYFHLWR